MLQDGPAAYLFLPFIFVILWKRLVSLSLRPIMTRAGQVARPMLNKHLITRHVFGCPPLAASNCCRDSQSLISSRASFARISDLKSVVRRFLIDSVRR